MHPSLHSERTREREFYKYYDPVRALSPSEPTRIDIKDAQARACHTPRAGPVLALTAFCQLGALRLGLRRALLFFFDRRDAFILAEATRSLSLLDHHTHQDDDDELWLGHAVVPRGLTLCEHTMSIPASNTASNSSDANAGDVLIINDLHENSSFCDRPFVTEGPKARFYAGVPLTTPAGVRIGVYAVMDDQPRQGLSDVEVDFMKEMAAASMGHLEMLNAQTELSRQSRMLAGLGTFVRDGPPSAHILRSSERSFPSSAATASSKRRSQDEKDEAALKSASSPRTRSERSQLRNTAIRDFVSESEQEPADRRSVSQAHHRLDKQMDRDSGAGARSTLQRAADVIRNAMDADGMVFLNIATRGPDGTGSCQGSGTDTGTTDGDPDAGSDDSLQKTKNDQCRTLGASCRIADPIDPERLSMSNRFLQKLLRRHPEGKIWTYNSEGEVSSTESGSSDASSSDDRQRGGSQHSVPRQGRKSGEAAEIRRLFPHARAVCLVGMWDPIRGKWFAASFAWTYSPLRVFSQQGELAYLLAFCDVVMAKVSRREAKLTDRAKTDFISTVSHELRSPLHGIVGSLELLQDREDPIDQTLVAQMEKCTSSLADVIDHLLDFAKINHHTSRPKLTRKQLALTERRYSLDSVALSFTSEEATHSLARLTEEVADATYYSHCCNVGREASKKVDFVLDISSDADFHVSDVVGAWKRLCTNLIGNACKFTSSGHIAVSLKALSRRRKPRVAILSVSDTGCGMSQEFVENGLFRAFSQEDPLSLGAGLGLSVVAKLVKGLGGKLEVQSTQNKGTTMTVTIPINAGPHDEGMNKEIQMHDSTRLGLLQVTDCKDEDCANEGRGLQMKGLESACHRVGVHLTPPENAHINMVFEEDLPKLVQNGRLIGHTEGAHLIVLCRSLLSTFQWQKSELPASNLAHVEYVSQPFGPERIGTAIANCLRAMPRVVNGESSDEPAIEGGLMLALAKDEMTETKASLDETGHLEVVEPADTQSLELGKKKSLILTTTEVEASSSSEPSHSPEPPRWLTSRKLALLLVDDNPINLRLLVAYADKNKHPRLTAVNGQEAVDAYKASASMATGTTKPDVVFLDINMPIMDGFQAARHIRAFEKGTHITPTILIALTCLGSEDAKQEAVASGIDMFLTKPVRPRDLTRILQNIQEVGEEE